MEGRTKEGLFLSMVTPTFVLFSVFFDFSVFPVPHFPDLVTWFGGRAATSLPPPLDRGENASRGRDGLRPTISKK